MEYGLMFCNCNIEAQWVFYNQRGSGYFSPRGSSGVDDKFIHEPRRQVMLPFFAYTYIRVLLWNESVKIIFHAMRVPTQKIASFKMRAKKVSINE